MSLARNKTHTPPEPDLSELEGRSYTCIDGCALCCLCQPELLPGEEKEFMADPVLRAGITRKHISPEVLGAAIRLKGDYGACHFLNERRCVIYERRPHFCRVFPLNVFVGWRIQLNANMSCRGLGLPGIPLEQTGRELLSQYGDERLESELVSAAGVFAQFEENTKDAMVSQSFDSVRSAASMLVDELTDGIGLSRMMTYAEYGSSKRDSAPADLAKAARAMEAEADIAERALMDGVELFDLPDLSHLPVHVGPDLSWRIFKLEDKAIVGWELAEAGTTEEFCRLDPASVSLLPMSVEGRAALRRYVDVVNARDCFAGHAAYLCDMEGYEFNFGQVYIGTVANSVIDLWWRASLLAQLAGVDALGPDEVKEGIVFFDMDLLDLPTIGAFI